MIATALFLLTLGGFAAGSFYIPFKKVRNWAWESYWLTNGLFAWIIMPWVVVLLTVPNLTTVIREAPGSSIFWTYLFGLLWGVGAVTFGLAMRYLGMSLGYAIALGLCAVFGTIVPPIYSGTFGELFSQASGLTTLGGVLVCLIGIAICGWAGIAKEKELSAEEKKKTIEEFNFVKGLFVAIFAGVMSACMAFGFAAGGPIARLAVDRGTPALWQNNPVLAITLVGGFTTNLVWCMFLNVKNRTVTDYVNRAGSPLVNNYTFCALAGITWYLQFMFYGMGTTKMGEYSFASWTILMALIIAFSNMWGLIFREWKGVSRRTIRIIIVGICVVVLSVVFIGAGSWLKSIGK